MMMQPIWLLFCNQALVGRFGGQPCQDGRVWIVTRRYLELRNLDALNLNLSALREALCVGCRQLDHAADHRNGLMWQLANAEAMHLDQSGERVRRARQQPSVAGLESKPVVG